MKLKALLASSIVALTAMSAAPKTKMTNVGDYVAYIRHTASADETHNYVILSGERQKYRQIIISDQHSGKKHYAQAVVLADSGKIVAHDDRCEVYLTKDGFGVHHNPLCSTEMRKEVKDLINQYSKELGLPKY